MNKRGFIKTLEAVIAVLIVLIFAFTVSQKSTGSQSNTEAMRNIQEGLLEGISQENELRTCIVSTENALLEQIGGSGAVCPAVKQYVIDTLPNRFKSPKERFRLYICDPLAEGGVGFCTIPSELDGKKFVYTSAVIISSDLSEYNPRIVRLWMW